MLHTYSLQKCVDPSKGKVYKACLVIIHKACGKPGMYKFITLVNFTDFQTYLKRKAIYFCNLACRSLDIKSRRTRNMLRCPIILL